MVPDASDTYEVNGTPLVATALSFTALTTSVATTTFGQVVTLSASVRASDPGDGTPTGSVDFRDTTTGLDLGTVPLSGGVASLPIAILAAGGHTIVAAYEGDGTFCFSLDTLTLTVNRATPTITWVNPANITSGTALSGTQLDATASVPGTFVYTPSWVQC